MSETFKEGDISGLGKWHGQFKRKFLPVGKFKTNCQGNLEHIETGDTDYSNFELERDK